MPSKKVHTQLSVIENESTITHGARSWDDQFRDRYNYDRAQVLTKVINAWRSNPIAKRIIEVTTEFVCGDGFDYSAKNARVKSFLDDFWKHPINDMESQLTEWADEAWRSGDLFILFSLDDAGFPLVRAIPAEVITEIVTAPNDYRQELFYKKSNIDEEAWPAYDASGGQTSFVLHFPLNRAVGASFGESDLASVLYWITLHRTWLEDRAALNFYRQYFSFVISKKFASKAEKDAFSKDVSAHLPKKPGSALVTDPDEVWGILNPQLASFEAGEDGLAIKRMIAAGVGMPMHWLAEPESSTRTTAEAAGTPAFKRLKRRQRYLQLAILRVLEVAYQVYRLPANMPAKSDIEVTCPDITERDNANLAIAVQRVVNAFAPLYNAKLIDAEELIRLVYRFVGEVPPEVISKVFIPINAKPGGNAAGKATVPAGATDNTGADPEATDPLQDPPANG